jgi:hypothetical protein
LSQIYLTIANIKQKSLHGRYFKELEQPEINIQASHAWLKKSNIHPETEGFIQGDFESCADILIPSY